jgi:hypothetical protein
VVAVEQLIITVVVQAVLVAVLGIQAVVVVHNLGKHKL